MPKFNLVHCLLHPTKPHGLWGYNEVIETIAWGLKELGHEVTRSVNQPQADCVNIIFGAQVLPMAVLDALPPNAIVYNFEQIRNLGPEAIRPEVRLIASRCQIWDYSRSNLEAWTALGAGARVQVVPIGYAPILTRIPASAPQDIDVLMYGGSDAKRLRAFEILADAGLTVMFVCGAYGAERDSLIARAKLVLNVNRYHVSRVFEIVRVSYLLANRKAVVSVLEEDMDVEADIKACIRFTPLNNLAAECQYLAENAAARALLGEYGFSAISRRDIRKILLAPLAALT
ncbi:MAG: hypothetical protein M3N08_03755 [Pseudomonadota bacterium]|nr:hypothetical protein [Pseudomonadota bacterium]